MMAPPLIASGTCVRTYVRTCARKAGREFLIQTDPLGDSSKSTDCLSDWVQELVSFFLNSSSYYFSSSSTSYY